MFIMTKRARESLPLLCLDSEICDNKHFVAAAKTVYTEKYLISQVSL
jgi:hypothetical protein